MSKEITITLPDGSQKQAPVGVSGFEIANMIGAGLAKAAVAFSVNGEQRDLSDVVSQDADISIFTIDSDEAQLQFNLHFTKRRIWWTKRNIQSTINQDTIPE